MPSTQPQPNASAATTAQAYAAKLSAAGYSEAAQNRFIEAVIAAWDEKATQDITEGYEPLSIINALSKRSANLTAALLEIRKEKK